MYFIVYPYRKRGVSGWIAYDIDRDIAYRFHSERRIACWCATFAKRHGQVASIQTGPLNAIDVA